MGLGAVGCTPHLNEDASGSPSTSRPRAGDVSGSAAAEAGAALDAARTESPRIEAPRPPSGWFAGGEGRLLGGARDVEVDAWLASHGARWEPDPACWSGLGKPAPTNSCVCKQSLDLSGREHLELLVCRRQHEQVMHTVLYAVREGRLVAAMDAATQANGASSDEVPEGTAIGVGLDLVLRSGEIVLDDGGDCPRAIASVDANLATAPRGDHSTREFFAGMRRMYSEVCANRGRWVEAGGRLVHAR